MGPAIYLLLGALEPVVLAGETGIGPENQPYHREPYYRAVRRMFRDKNYVLIEFNSAPPRILFLGEGDSVPGMEPSPIDFPIDFSLLDLTSEHYDVRLEAVLMLADIGNSNAIAYLRLALNDPDKSVREAAEAALELSAHN